VIVPERVDPGRTLRPLRAGESGGTLALTIQSRVPRLQMRPGPDLAPQYGVDLTPYRALSQSFDFRRPLYLKVLTVSLVLLVTAAAAYAVVLRPLDQLMIQAGAIVLGIWGVRAILLGTGLSVVTLVDLVLMSVILFLLAIITLRTLWLMEARSHVRLFRRTLPPPPAEAKVRDARAKEGQPEKVPDLVPDDPPADRALAAGGASRALCPATRSRRRPDNPRQSSHRCDEGRQLPLVQRTVRAHPGAEVQPERADLSDRLRRVLRAQPTREVHGHVHALADRAADLPVVHTPRAA